MLLQMERIYDGDMHLISAHLLALLWVPWGVFRVIHFCHVTAPWVCVFVFNEQWGGQRERRRGGGFSHLLVYHAASTT